MFVHSLFRAVVATCLAAAQSNTLPGNPSGGFGITGTIVDADTGAPVPYARVAVSSQSHRDKFITVSAGERGQFAFTSLSPDKYRLRAEARGYFTQSFHQHNRFETAIVVGPNLNSSNIIFALSRESSIRGSVIDEVGEAVPDASVLLYQTGTSSGFKRTRLLQQVIANDEGSYEFPHLLAGRYFVAVSARPWYARHLPPSSPVASPQGRPQPPGQGSASHSEQQLSSVINVAYSVTFYPGVTQPEDAAAIDLQPGDQFVANISLQPVPAVRFSLSSNSVSHIDALQLESRAFDGARIPVFAQAMPGPTGTVEVRGVAPGRYSVQVSDTGKENSTTVSSNEIEVSTTGQVQAASGTPSASVGVLVRLDPGTALPQGGLLRFRNIARDADFDEEFVPGRLVSKHNLHPGTYEVSFENAAGVYIKTVSAAGAIVNGRTLQIKETSAAQLVVTLARASANVTGVALRESQPFAGAMIVLVPTDPAHNRSLFRRVESDSDGTFSLPGVVPGDYTLLALAKGWELEWRNPAALKPFLGQGQAVQVHENGTYQFHIQVQDTGTHAEASLPVRVHQ